MSEYYCNQLNGSEDAVVLGFLSDDGTIQEARISLRYGANLCRYTYKGLNIIDYEPVLLENGDFTGTPVLYPTPNRVENGVFKFRGKTYDQVKRGRRVFEHGLVYDESWELVDAHAAGKEALLITRIRWTIESPLFDAFPFPHTLTLTFQLRDGAIAITYDIFNDGSEELPYGFGVHPYFQKLSGEEKTIIELPIEYVMEATEELLPTGKISPTSESALDLTRPTAIGELDLDHVFLRAAVDKPAVIHYFNQGLRVNISATNDFSHFVVYTPAGMPFFCVENQTCSTNAHNLFDRGLREISGLKYVAPGSHKTGSVQYKIFPAQD